MTNHIIEIRDYGQSIWMDHLDRELIQSGGLKDLIENQGIRGITSNPKIFSDAITGKEVYNTDIESGVEAGRSTGEIYESLIFDDIRDACDILRPTYDESDGLDGYVSIEVSPELARDTQGTIEEARRFYQAIDRENVMIKIPGTPEGIPAVEQVTADGINVNVTLLFAVKSYEEAAWAYIRGLETRVANGEPIDKLASVASFFLSRIDVKVDKRIDERMKRIGTEDRDEEVRLSSLKGKTAIANAKVAYQKFKEITSSDRWRALAEKGANVQRLLWASTSTKDPQYSDVMYVDALVGPQTVNTLPPSTIDACADHCSPEANRIESEVDKAYTLLGSLGDPDIQIDLDQVMDELLDEGIEKFAQPYHELLESIEGKAKRLTSV